MEGVFFRGEESVRKEGKSMPEEQGGKTGAVHTTGRGRKVRGEGQKKEPFFTGVRWVTRRGIITWNFLCRAIG